MGAEMIHVEVVHARPGKQVVLALDVPAGTTVGEAIRLSGMHKEFPDLVAHQSCVRLACNGAYATTGELFKGEDEVALIPPVSGG